MSDLNKKYWIDDPEMVEKYVLNQISEEEKKRLDAEILDCEPCKEKLQQEMEIATGIRRYGRDIMKARLRKKLSRERASQFFQYQYIGLAAAVVIIAIGIGVYQVWFSDLVAPKQFHQQEIVFQPHQDSAETRIESSGEGEQRQRTPRQIERRQSVPPRDIAQSQERREETAIVSQPSSAPPSAGAIADADVPSDELKSTENNASAIWLIGYVVVVNEARTEQQFNASKMEMSKRSDEQTAKEKSTGSQSTEKLIVQRRANNEGIVLQRRSMKDLPAERLPAQRVKSSTGRSRRTPSEQVRTQRAADKKEIETLLEWTESGISLTLFDDSVNENDLHNAVIETMTDDSLVVSLPNQRIAYRLPSGWNSQSTRRR